MLVLISMLVGGKLSEKDMVERSILSILTNIGTNDFLLVIGISSLIGPEIFERIRDIKLVNSNHIKISTEHCDTSAGFHNHVFLKYGMTSKWFIVSHDDIELKTKDLISCMEKSLRNFTNVGWISFTDDDYLNGHWAPSVRPGFHYDFLYENAWPRRKMWQYHLLEENYWKRRCNFSNLNYSFPKSVVKCHSPFCHFIAVESEKLRRIGLWEIWNTVSLLADEDQGLSFLKAGLINVWIPNIVYTHFRTEKGTRSWPLIEKEGKQTHELFLRKWGFPIPPTKNDLGRIKKMYGNTNIVWSINKKSFDWEYLK